MRKAAVVLGLLLLMGTVADAQCLDVNQALRDLRDQTYRRLYLREQHSFDRFFWSDEFEQFMKSQSAGFGIKIPIVGEALPISFSNNSNQSFQRRRTVTDRTSWRTDRAIIETAYVNLTPQEMPEILNALSNLCREQNGNADRFRVLVDVITDIEVRINFRYEKELRDRPARFRGLRCSAVFNCANASGLPKNGEPLEPRGTTFVISWADSAPDDAVGTISLLTDGTGGNSQQIRRSPKTVQWSFEADSGQEYIAANDTVIAWLHPNRDEIGCWPFPPNSGPLPIEVVAGFDSWCTDKWIAARKNYHFDAPPGERFISASIVCQEGGCSHVTHGPGSAAIASDSTSVSGWVQNSSSPVLMRLTVKRLKESKIWARESKVVRVSQGVVEVTLPNEARGEGILETFIGGKHRELRLRHGLDVSKDGIQCRAKRTLSGTDFSCTVTV